MALLRRDLGQRKGNPVRAPRLPGNTGQVYLVHSVAVTISFAENRAMFCFEIDPDDGEPEFFRVTAKSDGERIANRDSGWQANVAIGPAGRGHEPTAAFGQHTRAPPVSRL
jgi:hypothetical protein